MKNANSLKTQPNSPVSLSRCGGFGNVLWWWICLVLLLSCPVHGQLVLEGHTDELRSVAWSPDGSQLASGSIDKTVKIWNANTGRVSRTLTEHDGAVTSVAWSPDGTQLASGSLDDTV